MMSTQAASKAPVRRRKEARPAEIVAAGIAEFATHGFANARLDRIATRAGIAKGTIYLYFPSKEALFVAAIEDHVINLMKETESDLTGFDGSTEALLRRLLERVYAKIVTPENQSLLRILISESQRVPELAATYHEMTFARGMGILTAVIERGVARGEMEESAVTRTPLLIMAPAVFMGVHNLIFADLEELDFEQFFEGHLEPVLRGLGIRR